MILDNGYDYLCVNRSSLKNYNIEAGAVSVSVTDNSKQKIELCRVNSDRNTDYYLKVESHSKELKERSMNAVPHTLRSRTATNSQQLDQKRRRKTRR